MNDLRCYDDLDLFGAECDDEMEMLEQDIIHRLIERRGSNLDDPDAGEAIVDYLSTAESLDYVRHRFAEEIRKDDRVATADVLISRSDTGSNAGATYDIDITVTTTDGLLLQTTLPVAVT